MEIQQPGVCKFLQSDRTCGLLNSGKRPSLAYTNSRECRPASDLILLAGDSTPVGVIGKLYWGEHLADKVLNDLTQAQAKCSHFAPELDPRVLKFDFSNPLADHNVLEYQEIAHFGGGLHSLEPGKVIKFSRLENLDEMLRTVAVHMAHGDSGSYLQPFIEAQSRLPGQVIQSFLNRMKFYGTRANMRAIVLNPALLGHTTKADPFESFSLMFLTELTLIKKNLGSLGVGTTIWRGIGAHTSVRTEILDLDFKAKLQDQIVTDSRLRWLGNELAGLINPYQGGLPGLGKKR